MALWHGRETTALGDGRGWAIAAKPAPRRHAARAPRNALPLLAMAFAVALLAACSRPAPLAGTDLGGIPAPDFALTDQEGRTVRLSALPGRPVVVTFLFTACPDVCPLTAEKLRRVVERLGADASRVSLLAVSVDPEHDDAAAARAFVERHGLGDRLQFLLGSRGDLEPVWAAYYVAVGPAPDADAAARAAGAYAARTAFHTDALFVVDRQGRERSLLRSDFEPDALAATLKRLLGE